MNQITFPRTSYDGIVVEKSELEEWFLKGKSKTVNGKKNYNLVSEIGIKLNAISSAITNEEKRLLTFVRKNLDYILVCPPEKLEKLVLITNKYFNCLLKKNKFNSDLFNAFNYEGYRENKLIDLACFLNVKSCPYCNMSYTLFAENGKHYKYMVTKFQFDHFYDKQEYPFLSMSLYNLIPSCAVCNQNKSRTRLSLRFHPYLYVIHEQFNFKLEDKLSLLYGAKKDKLNLTLELGRYANAKKTELDNFDNLFDIKLRYTRHKDIVQEVFDKAYLERYYSDSRFFAFMEDKFKNEYLRRLMYGSYMDESEIEKRPMSKFIQDIRKQALEIANIDFEDL